MREEKEKKEAANKELEEYKMTVAREKDELQKAHRVKIKNEQSAKSKANTEAKRLKEELEQWKNHADAWKEKAGKKGESSTSRSTRTRSTVTVKP